MKTSDTSSKTDFDVEKHKEVSQKINPPASPQLNNQVKSSKFPFFTAWPPRGLTRATHTVASSPPFAPNPLPPVPRFPSPQAAVPAASCDVLPFEKS